jgi:twitching motility protein PilT
MRSAAKQPPVESSKGMMHLDQLLHLMTDKEASDLHLRPMRPPLLRVHGRLMPVDDDPLQPEEIEGMIRAILNPAQQDKLSQDMALDLGYGVSGLARFRGNIFLQRGTLAAVFRRVPYETSTLDELGLPDVLEELTHLRMGLVLVTGPTGCGKSTTLASLLKYITSSRPVHVVTIEDPIEFLFRDEVATVSQREVGTDTPGFQAALRNAMRQDPDVIMVGEMRDPETVATVISAAETGHLVFSTLHTNSATQSVDRILDTFPGDQQRQVRIQLAQVLKAVVSMKLVERADGEGRVPAIEVMRASPRISELVEKGETEPLTEEVESSVSYYRMQSMNQSLLALLAHGTITYAEAMSQSPDPEDLSLKLRKMFPSIEERGGDMSPSTADFSQILELQQFKKLYEEQEEKHKARLSERDETISSLEQSLADRNEEVGVVRAQVQELTEQQQQLRSEYNRLRQEAQQKIDKLSGRIKELNQRIMDGNGK